MTVTARAIPIAVKTPANRAFASSSKLTTDLAKPPVTGNPEEMSALVVYT